MSALLTLLASRRFMPLFLTQFAGALNDNLFKNAMLVFTLYVLADRQGLEGAMLMPIGAGVFILPFFLFSATAGQLADRFDKAMLVRLTKTAEILIAVAGAIALISEDLWMMMGVLFLLGTQSAVFGPLKYALLPESLRRDELVAGNGLIEAGTFLAILAGTIAGGILVMLPDGPVIVAWALVGVAAFGFATAVLVPSTGRRDASVTVMPNPLRATLQVIGEARRSRTVFLAIFGISWFWLVGAVFLAQIPAFAKDVTGGDETVVTLFMTTFSIGIGLGSILCARLLAGEVSVRHVPLASIGVALFSADLWWAASGLPTPAGVIDAWSFMTSSAGLRILADLTMIAACGGLFVVPLYAFVQDRTPEHERARVIAANNILNAALMVVGSLAVTGLIAVGATVPEIFLVIAAASVVAAAIICKILPQELFKSIAAWVFRILWRVEVRGLENLKGIDGPSVIVANHVSWLDGPLLATFMPGTTTFAINSFVFKTWWGRLAAVVADMIAVDPTNPMSTKAMIRAVDAGKRLVIFPEGRLTVTGSLMKVYDGPAMIVERTGALLVPVKIDGTRFSRLSRLKGRMPLRWFPKITITVLPPQRISVPEDLRGRPRRRMAGAALYDVMSGMMFSTQATRRSLFSALLEARDVYGGKAPVIEDITTLTRPLSYDRLILGSCVLGRKLAAVTAPGERVGLLLPNSVGVTATFFGLVAFGRIPAMLNFSTGADTLLSACRTATLKTVITSRVFVEKARLQATITALADHVIIFYLEDIRQSLTLVDKLAGKVLARRAGSLPQPAADDPAVVLFTSGSEGLPKGVVLSHTNLLSNLAQIAARVDFSPADRVFNALPVFHSFGLTGGLLLPVLSGIRTFLYPSPLHYRIVPELVYDTNSTILFGTDTFLSGYARMANPYDFYAVRYVFAGAERVHEETRRTWMDRFGVRILEGYGATETAPVLAVNTPMHFKAGTVGRLLPGIEARLDAVPGVTEGQRLSVRGPNVMIGYLKSDTPGVLQPPSDGWYDTGDIVSVDTEGFVAIKGRAKRFVKIAGEMVSLGSVEDMAAALWPGHVVAAVGVPDARKGEQVILVTDHAEATREALLAQARSTGASELRVPKTVLVVDRVPILGSGKTDYPAVARLVETRMTAAVPA